MTEGHGTCGQTNSREKASPKGGEPHPVLLLFAPFGDDKRVSVTIRRFHSLRSFHPRLFTFAPFGDGRMLLAKLQFFYFLSSQPSLWVELGSLLAKLELEDVFRANTTQSLTGTYLLTLMNADRFQITVNRDVGTHVGNRQEYMNH